MKGPTPDQSSIELKDSSNYQITLDFTSCDRSSAEYTNLIWYIVLTGRQNGEEDQSAEGFLWALAHFAHDSHFWPNLRLGHYPHLDWYCPGDRFRTHSVRFLFLSPSPPVAWDSGPVVHWNRWYACERRHRLMKTIQIGKKHLQNIARWKSQLPIVSPRLVAFPPNMDRPT